MAARWAKRHPLLFSVGFSALKTGAADAVAQTCLNGSAGHDAQRRFDWRRNAAFWMFGAWFLGWAQYLVLVCGMRVAFPGLKRHMTVPLGQRLRDAAFHRTVLRQSLFELGLWVPFAYLPAYYWTKMTVQGASADRIVSTLRSNWVTDLYAFYTAWVPFTLANYYATPLWLRVPAIGAHSMLWTVYLSATRGEL